VASLGAVPIKLCVLPLPDRSRGSLAVPAASLSVRALDTALTPRRRGWSRVERGRRSVASRSAPRRLTPGRLRLDDGATYEASTAFLATGKHDLRVHGRPETSPMGRPSRCITAVCAQTADLATPRLTLYSGGYGGIQRWKTALRISAVWSNGGILRVRVFAGRLLAKMQQDCPHLAMRLAGARPLLDKPDHHHHYPVRIQSAAKQRMGFTASAIRQPSSPRSPAMAYPSRCILPARRAAYLARSRRRFFSHNCAPQCCPRCVLPTSLPTA